MKQGAYVRVAKLLLIECARRHVIFTVAFLAFGFASAAEYFISPSGNNGNPGSSSKPWKTFAHAISRVQPGDSLVLLDGTYTKGTTGFIEVNGKHGTKAKPITIMAQNERKAFLKSNGDGPPLFLFGCTHWNIIGLRARNADVKCTERQGRFVFSLDKCQYMTMKRCLGSHNNRYHNGDIVWIHKSQNILVEECEAYHFHRHGMCAFLSECVTFRRCYANSRGRTSIAGGWPPHLTNRGDEGFVFYYSKRSIVENCIDEGNEMICSYGVGNRILGNVTLNNMWGICLQHHCCNSKYDEKDDLVINNVAINSIHNGFMTQSAINATIENCTAVRNGRGQGYHGLHANNKWDSRNNNGGRSIRVTPSLTVRNSLFLNNYGQGVHMSHVSDFAFRVLDYLCSFGHKKNYGPGTETRKNSLEIDPKLGSCVLFIPEGSPMKGAGKNGADIGANVLYRYENGVLTDKPLWDPKSGSFPHGAVIVGINGKAGSSCFDVHKRLNVSAGTLPAGYGGGRPVISPIRSRTTQALARMRAGIFDVNGRLIRRLEATQAGPNFQPTLWDAGPNRMAGGSSGIHFYRLRMGDGPSQRTITKKAAVF